MLDTADIFQIAKKFDLSPRQQRYFKQGFVHFYQNRKDLLGDDPAYDFGYTTASLFESRMKIVDNEVAKGKTQ